MLLKIWKNQLLSVDDRLDAAYGEIDRLNDLLEKKRGLFDMRNDTDLSVTDETWLFMEWAGSQPVELEDKHLDELGFWCWEAWKARANMSPNAVLSGKPRTEL